MYYQKKVKAIPAKGLTKDLIINLIFLMTHNTCIQDYYKIILYLYQLQNTFNIFMTNIQIICGNLMEGQKKVLKI